MATQHRPAKPATQDPGQQFRAALPLAAAFIQERLLFDPGQVVMDEIRDAVNQLYDAEQHDALIVGLQEHDPNNRDATDDARFGALGAALQAAYVFGVAGGTQLRIPTVTPRIHRTPKR